MFNKGSELKTIAAEFLISTYGIGKAKLGMTLGELKQKSDQDTEFEPISPFTEDLNAIAVSAQGIVQYYKTILNLVNGIVRNTEYRELNNPFNILSIEENIRDAYQLMN